jgi:hypothetical protein
MLQNIWWKVGRQRHQKWCRCMFDHGSAWMKW